MKLDLGGNVVSYDKESAMSMVATPQKEDEQETRSRRQPPYHVVLWDDDQHTYAYVVRMMQRLFRATRQHGYAVAAAVDTNGKAICLTTTLEHAELKRNQILAFGADKMIQGSPGSMRATIEPAS